MMLHADKKAGLVSARVQNEREKRVSNTPILCVEGMWRVTHTWNVNDYLTSPYTCSVMLLYYNVFGNDRQTISIPRE